MSSRVFFENTFDNDAILENLSEDGLHQEFKKRIVDFQTAKLKYLKSSLHSDIFVDGTVYTGSCGLALYYYLRYQNTKNNDEYLHMSWSYIDLTKLKSKRITFLCGDAGPLALAAVISYKLGANKPANIPEYTVLVHSLMSLISLCQNSPDELLYGKAGYLYALLFVNKEINEGVIPDGHIEKVVSAIIKSGKEFSVHEKSASPLLWEWHEKVYLGGAHGVAGILYTLLQAHKYISDREMSQSVRPTVDWVLGRRLPSGNYPSSLGSSSGDRLVQWCHGAPGFTALCLAAHKIFKSDDYMAAALRCGEVTWSRGLCTKGYSICHGVAGNAYTFLQLYRATKERTQLARAAAFLDWCMRERAGAERRAPDRPASLFEGLVGRLYLAEDIIEPERARFPAYDL